MVPRRGVECPRNGGREGARTAQETSALLRPTKARWLNTWEGPGKGAFFVGTVFINGWIIHLTSLSGWWCRRGRSTDFTISGDGQK